MRAPLRVDLRAIGDPIRDALLDSGDDLLDFVMALLDRDATILDAARLSLLAQACHTQSFVRRRWPDTFR